VDLRSFCVACLVSDAVTMNFSSLEKNRFKRFSATVPPSSALSISAKTYDPISELVLTTRYGFSYLKACLFKLIISFSRIELCSRINSSAIISLDRI
jgi:hypothetical protein